MQPVVVLMTEHRLIERMIRLIRREMQDALKIRQIDTALLDAAVDFIRWYADRTHHAKEEAILFRDLARKEISPTERGLLQELIADHDFGRKTVGRLVAEKEKYLLEPNKSIEPFLEIYETLTDFYQEHIRKEDHIFFPAATRYFSELETLAMLREFWEADRQMIHVKYEARIDQLEKIKH